MSILVNIPIALVVFFLPGYAWLFAWGLTQSLGRFGSVALSFVLSICFVSLMAAALSFVTTQYLEYSIVVLFVVPAVVVLLSALMQHKLPVFAMPSANFTLLLVLLSVLIYAVFLIAVFWSAPIYPASFASDPVTHAQIVEAIFNGGGRSVITHSSYAVGLHFAAAVLMNLLGTNSLQALRILVSFAILASIVLIYASARELLGDEKLAICALIVGAFAMPADAMHLTLIGTYPNIVVDSIIFAALFSIFSNMTKPTIRIWPSLAILSLEGVFTHSSYILFLGVLVLTSPIIWWLFRKAHVSTRYLKGVGYAISGVLLGVIAASAFFLKNLERPLQGYNVVGTGTIPQAVAVLPILYESFARNLVFLIKPINLIAILVGIILIGIRQRSRIGQVFVASWLIALVLLCFVSGQTDRFVLFAILPSTFIVGNLVGNIPDPRAKWKNKIPRLLDRRAAASLIILLLVATGGFLPLLATAYDPANRIHQEQVFASMEWMKQNGCTAAASVGLGDYRYLTALTGLPYTTTLVENTTPNKVLQESVSAGFNCVAMGTTNPIYQSFVADKAFQAKYRNSEIAIFVITH